jgi:hypothetical protein
MSTIFAEIIWFFVLLATFLVVIPMGFIVISLDYLIEEAWMWTSK